LLMPILKGRARHCVHAQRIQSVLSYHFWAASNCVSPCLFEEFKMPRHFVYGINAGIIAGCRGLHVRGRPYPCVRTMSSGCYGWICIG